MPVNAQKPAALSPASPRNTAKYTNKDGSKFITVPKGSPDSSQPSTPSLPATNDHNHAAPHHPGPGYDDEDDDDDDDDDDEEEPNVSTPTISRKKQKRKQKAAAKAATANGLNGHAHTHALPAAMSAPLSAHGHGHAHAHAPRHGAAAASIPPPPPQDQDSVDTDDDDDVHYRPRGQPSQHTNGEPSTSSKSKKSRKKKKRNAASEVENDASPALPPHHPEPPRGPGMSRDKIWSTSNHEERERIKEFWLGLGEEERKSLVKVEKDAVLRKMKEQQKHTCSCTVCGRKRNAIEEELEGLYDAYYVELEQFANQGEGPPMLPPPRDFPIRPPRGLPAGYAGHPPSRGRIVEHVGDEDDEEEEIEEEVYSEDEVDDDEYSDEEPPEPLHSTHDRDVADFLTFGNSLQVKGGILTVADDLLKNDGKRFIEMMEQLAERRMAREEDARDHFSRGFGHSNGSFAAPHNHPPPEEEEEYEDEEDDEDDYEDSQDDEYEDEEDQMTEAQRMEEGRRMFQIFAARMFEQRVLSAYKEKVAKERQQKLLEEIEEENRHENEQKAKKAKLAQKKKDKAAQRKQLLSEEKARKEAEKAAEDAARIEAEQKRVAEQKQKADEKRRQKEAQRKADEEARLRKEAERLRRIHEQKEKQAEQERKAREAKEREKKAKEEQRIKDKEAREQKEREAQERKEKQERDKKDKEARAAKAHRDAQEAMEAKARAKAAAAAGLIPPQVQLAKRGQQQQQQPVPVPTTAVLPHHPPNPASFVSPKVPIATPVIPKTLPTPGRTRAPSQQQQQQQPPQQHDGAFPAASGPGPSPSLSPRSSNATRMSPGSIGQERKSSFGTTSGVPFSVSPPLGIPTTSSLLSTAFHGAPIGMQPPPGLPHQGPPGFGSRLSNDAGFSGFRPNPSGLMMTPPGMNGPAGRGMAPGGPIGHPAYNQPLGDQFQAIPGYGMPKDAPSPLTHTRQGSGAFDAIGATAMPIGRPAPIGRPGSTSRGQLHDDTAETKRLGSSVLVDDDEPLVPELNPGSLTHRTHAPGPRQPVFGVGPFMDGGFPRPGHNPWAPSPTAGNGQQQHFPPPGFGNPGWGAPLGMPQGFTVGSPGGGLGGMRTVSQPPRHVMIRQMLCTACKVLSGGEYAGEGGFVAVGALRNYVENQSGDASITVDDLTDLCDTEGNASNGGGTFEVKPNGNTQYIRWLPDAFDTFGGMHGGAGGGSISGAAGGGFRSAVGEIGSPPIGFASSSSRGF